MHAWFGIWLSIDDNTKLSSVAQEIHPLHAFTGTVTHFVQKLVLLAVLHAHALETVYSDYSTDYDVATPASLCKEVGATWSWHRVKLLGAK